MVRLAERIPLDSSDDEELRADERIPIPVKDVQKRQLSPLKNGNMRQTPAHQRTLAKAHDTSLFQPVAFSEPRRKARSRPDFSAEGLSLLTPKPKLRQSPSKLLLQPQTDLRQTLRSINLEPVANNIFDISESEAENEAPSSLFSTEMTHSDCSDDVPVKPQSRRAIAVEDDQDLATEMQALGLSDSVDESSTATPTKSKARVSQPTDLSKALPATPRRALEPVSPCVQNKQMGSTKKQQSPEQAKEVWKSNLPSPSKKKAHIPPNPKHGPSSEGFWSVEEVNNWNDHHSPQKIIRSPKKAPIETLSSKLVDLSIFASDDEAQDDNDLPSSRRKMEDASKSPARKGGSKTEAETLLQASRAAKQARKAFDEIKTALAAEFIIELDNAISDGAISRLAEPNGGIQLVWSKTLNTTAGRAHHRSQRISGTNGPKVWIELSEKILTDEYRLRNTLAHEYCHLYVFTINKLKESHGKNFKAVGARVMTAFSKYDIHVTTRHNYEIDFKYKWQCVGHKDRPLGSGLMRTDTANEPCGQIYGRHSKSIDPARQGCGRCKGDLVQIAPAPRGDGRANSLSPKKAPNAWQKFVAENIKAVREEMGAGVTQKAVMEELGVRYRKVAHSPAVPKADEATSPVAEPETEIELEPMSGADFDVECVSAGEDNDEDDDVLVSLTETDAGGC